MQLVAGWELRAVWIELRVENWNRQVVCIVQGLEQTPEGDAAAGSAWGPAARGRHRHAATEHVEAEEAVEPDATADRS